MSQDKQPHSTHQADSIMLTLVLILAAFGLLILFSASEYNGRVRFHDSAYYFKKQLFATALGLGAMYLVSSIDYHFFVRLAPAAYLLSMLLSTAVLLFGQEINGSKRWLNLGPLSFQPSEFAKVSVVLFLTWQIERSHKRTDGFWFMCRTMLTLLPIVGLVGSNNLSTAIIILGIGVILIFAASPRYIQFAALGGAGIGFIAIFLAAESYRLERLAIWREPEKYEKGFQTIQGLYAIGSGGLELRRQVSNEAHHFREFARFQSLENQVYVSHLEPRNDVIMLVGNHFANRMPSEHWMIIDDNRKTACVHVKDGENYLRYLTDDEFSVLQKTESYEDEYTDMWKTFFHAISIEQRKNYVCQRNLFPIWKRKHAVEFR